MQNLFKEIKFMKYPTIWQDFIVIALILVVIAICRDSEIKQHRYEMSCVKIFQDQDKCDQIFNNKKE